MSQIILKKERNPSILILDFGSQYSELIARRIRETNVFSLVVSNCISIEEIKNINPKGIILSGGPNSVYEQNAPNCDEKIFNLGIPILGICYGMQLMVKELGGSVVSATKKAEYGRAPINIDQESDLLSDVKDKSIMWMSHGDSINYLPDGFNKSIAEKLFLNLSNTIEERSLLYVNRYLKTDMEIASIIFDKKREIRWAGNNGNKYVSHFQ